jgi:hypothetical protein
MALFFQNACGQPVWVAFAYHDPRCGPTNQLFRKQGWWKVDSLGFPLPGNWRLNAWDVDLRRVNRFAYFYAATANLAATWSGTGNGWLSVNPQAAFDKCAFEDPGNGLWVDFNELDFTWADAGWDFVVTFWYWEGTYRVQYSQQQRRADDSVAVEASPIGPR